MQTIDTNAFLLGLLGLFVIYLLAAMIAAGGWVLSRLFTGRPVFSPSPLVNRRPVPWGVWTVLLLVAMTLILPTVVFLGDAKANGLLPIRSSAHPPAGKAQAPAAATDEKHSPQVRPNLSAASSVESKVEPARAQAAQKPNHAVPAPEVQPAAPPDAAASKDALQLSLTENLAIGAFSSVVLLVLAPLVLRLTSRSPLRDLGLSFDKWWLQAVAGVIAFLAIEPVLLATQFAMTRIWESNAHPLFKMVREEFSPGVPQLAILLAVFIAPMWEEFLFRGVIQSWMVRHFEWLEELRFGGGGWIKSRSQRRPPEPAPVLVESLAGTASELEPAAFRATPASPEFEQDFGPSVELPPKPVPAESKDDFPNPWAAPRVEPPGKPLSTTPIKPRGGPRPAAHAGIITTSLIFGALHFDQWPAPIAVFLLAVAIGYVYERTGSLIAAFCMHATFNGLSTLFVLGSLLVPQSAQDPEVKKVNPPAVVTGFSTPCDYACIHWRK
jgi:membrane protease YdiL (CAAX protease family)